MPNRGEALQAARQQLREAGITSFALDARLLLQFSCGLCHEEIVAEPSQDITQSQWELFHALIKRRQAHEPVSRIMGVREFYGRQFIISPAVLDPRPDSETVIDLALTLRAGQTAPHLLDLGTGTGALGLSLLGEWPQATAVLTDISAEALGIAQKNCDHLGLNARCIFLQSDWLLSVYGKFDLIISNPPYISAVDMANLPPDVQSYDPHGALTPGTTGLEAYAQIAAQARSFLTPQGKIILEMGAEQGPMVERIFHQQGFNTVGFRADLAGWPRAVAFS